VLRCLFAQPFVKDLTVLVAGACLVMCLHIPRALGGEFEDCADGAITSEVVPAENLAYLCYEGLRSSDPEAQARSYRILSWRIRSRSASLRDRPDYYEDFVHDRILEIVGMVRSDYIKEPGTLLALIDLVTERRLITLRQSGRYIIDRNSRSQVAGPHSGEVEDLLDILPSQARDPARLVELAVSVERILSRIDPRRQEILVRAYVLGQSRDEIAASMGNGETNSTVSAALHFVRSRAAAWASEPAAPGKSPSLHSILQDIDRKGAAAPPPEPRRPATTGVEVPSSPQLSPEQAIARFRASDRGRLELKELIWALRGSGLNNVRIARLLGASGIPTAEGSSAWRDNSVGRLAEEYGNQLQAWPGRTPPPSPIDFRSPGMKGRLPLDDALESAGPGMSEKNLNRVIYGCKTRKPAQVADFLASRGAAGASSWDAPAVTAKLLSIEARLAELSASLQQGKRSTPAEKESLAVALDDLGLTYAEIADFLNRHGVAPTLRSDSWTTNAISKLIDRARSRR
jgi:DNA-directed RNA polymerase specialized sigma24 family protein